MAYTYSTGPALQVVHNNISLATGQASTAYAYVDIPGTATTITLKGNNSVLYLQTYVNGWGNGGNGVNIAFKINGVVHANSSSSGDQWCRAINGGTANRSWGIGRIYLCKPGLSIGNTVTVGLMLGTWSTAGVHAGWSSYQTYFHTTIIELSQS